MPNIRAESIGDRIKRLRRSQQPVMTQQALANRAGVSTDLISKLEQNVKQTALIGSLHKIARALGVDVSELVSQPAARPAPDGLDSGVPALRRAVTGLPDLVDAGGDVPGLEALGQSVSHAWGAYWAGRYDMLINTLASLVVAARRAARDASAGSRPLAHGLLSQTYQVVASLCAYLRYPDLAHLALDRALVAAGSSDDPLERTAVVKTMSWLMLKEARCDEALHLALAEADQTEPRLSTARPEQWCVWGALVLTAATAAARDGQPDRADDLIRTAGAAATRLGSDRADYQTLFGPSHIVMQSVDVAVVTGRFGQALTTARAMPQDAPLPTAAKARHLSDVAYSMTNLGRDSEAVDVLLFIERFAPDWMRYQALPRAIVGELVERERRVRTPQLRGLAERLKLTA